MKLSDKLPFFYLCITILIVYILPYLNLGRGQVLSLEIYYLYSFIELCRVIVLLPWSLFEYSLAGISNEAVLNLIIILFIIINMLIIKYIIVTRIEKH